MWFLLWIGTSQMDFCGIEEFDLDIHMFALI